MDIEFDESTRTVLLRGKIAPLPPQLMRLLGALLAAAPRAVPHDELLARVWGRCRDTASRNVVSNAVSRLRAALAPVSDCTLVAVRGSGYAWCADVNRCYVENMPEASEGIDRSGESSSLSSPQRDAEQFLGKFWAEFLLGRAHGPSCAGRKDSIRACGQRADVELAENSEALSIVHATLAMKCRLDQDGEGAVYYQRRSLTALQSIVSQGNSDACLIAHFELCAVLLKSADWAHPEVRLAEAQIEIDRARAVFDRLPFASKALRLAAARVAVNSAQAHGRLEEALENSANVMLLTEAVSAGEERTWWQERSSHAMLLLQAGHEKAAVLFIDDLFVNPEAPVLPISDIAMTQARLLRGAIRHVVGRHNCAVAVLEPLHNELRKGGGARSGLGPAVALWLASSLAKTGRVREAVRLARQAYELLKNLHPSFAPAVIDALNCYAQALLADGRGADALSLYEAGFRPLLVNHGAPHEQNSVLALTAWIDTLIAMRRIEEAAAMFTYVRPEALRAATYRPMDAASFLERCQRAGIGSPDEREISAAPPL